jgi:hypothetical protein
MFGFSPKLPIGHDERTWVNEGFKRLENLVGRQQMLEAKVIEPTAEDFPDTYDKTPAAAEKLFARVCGYMKVDCSRIELEIFQDETEELRKILPYWQGNSEKCAAGMYIHRDRSEGDVSGAENPIVAIRSSQMKDPMSLVATIAHELGHAILLGRKLMTAKTSDHEPMTDLLTVFLGLGIFTANSAGRFTQYQDDKRAGWSMQRLGYLPENVFGYALAKFAAERGELKPRWARHLSPNVKADFKQARRWLEQNPLIGYLPRN